MTLKPAAFIAASTASGGGAAAVAKLTTCGSGFFSASRRVEQDRHHDRRAAQMRHLVLAIASYIAVARTARRQTCVPATIDTVHGKHQPLQWNIGSVHR